MGLMVLPPRKREQGSENKATSFTAPVPPDAASAPQLFTGLPLVSTPDMNCTRIDDLPFLL